MGAFGAYEQNVAAGPFGIYRGETDANDQPIFEQREYSDYIVPPKGQYRLKVTGFAKPATVPIGDKFKKVDGPTTKEETKLELEIVSERGKGKRWINSYVTMSLGDMSNLYKIYLAGFLKGDKEAAPMSRLYDDILGTEFDAFVNVSDKLDKNNVPIRAMLAWDTVSVASDSATAYDPFNEEKIAS